ncbi:MAG: PA14 domain-containing protein [Bacillota bacterium]
MLDRGLIIDMGKHSVTVLTKDNAYYKLTRKPTMFISQEIEFKQSDIINASYFAKRFSSLAACLFFVLGIALFFNMMPTGEKEEFAYISLDINPSMEFTIDKNENILKVDRLDKDAEELTESIDFKGMKLNSALSEIIKKCKDKGIIDNNKAYFLISGSVNPDNVEVRKDTVYADNKLTKMLDEIKGSMEKAPVKENEIIVLKIDPVEREKARESNITSGQYAVYTELTKLGAKISVEEVKVSTVADLVEMYIETKTEVPEVTPLPSPAITHAPSPTLTAEALTSAKTWSVSPTSAPTPTPTLTPAIITAQTLIPTPTSITPTLIKTPSPIPTMTITPAPTPSPTPSQTLVLNGTGLRGEYYDNIDLSNLKFTRIDPIVNFFWSSISPDSRITNDESYSMRWTGQIMPQYSEEYTFYVTRDNGARLWIDNQLIIDEWNSGWNVTDTGSIVLERGQKYDIRLEFFNNTGNAFIKLEWSSKSTRRAIVPHNCLFPATTPLPVIDVVPGDGTGLFSEYYDNEDLTDLKVTGIDPTINFDWGVGTPDKLIKPDYKFSIRWTGQIQPVYSEEYVFYITHDDGVRLWINNELVLDKWVSGSRTVSETDKIAFKADQKYDIKIEYYNSSLAGSVKLEWSSPSTPRSIVPQTRLYP